MLETSSLRKVHSADDIIGMNRAPNSTSQKKSNLLPSPRSQEDSPRPPGELKGRVSYFDSTQKKLLTSVALIALAGILIYVYSWNPEFPKTEEGETGNNNSNLPKLPLNNFSSTDENLTLPTVHEIEEPKVQIQPTEHELNATQEHEDYATYLDRVAKERAAESARKRKELEEQMAQHEKEHEENMAKIWKEHEESLARIRKESADRTARMQKEKEEREAEAKKRRAARDEESRLREEEYAANHARRKEERREINERLKKRLHMSREQQWRDAVDSLQANDMESLRPDCMISTDDFQHLSDVDFITNPALNPTCWFHAKAMLGRGEEGGFNQETFIDKGCSYVKQLFRKESLEVHPDKGGSSEAMERLTTARDTICNLSEHFDLSFWMKK